MHLIGVGSGHDADTHHVTNCMHNHSHYNHVGSMGPGAASSAGSSHAIMEAQDQADAQLTLSAWMEKTLGRGRRLWGSIWGSSDAAASAQPGNQSGAEQALAQISDTSVMDGRGVSLTGQNSSLPDDPRSVAQNIHVPQIAAAATALQPQELQHNPYFSAVDSMDEQRGTLWKHVKVKLKNMAGQLAGHLPGKFFGAQSRSSLQAKQERPREDLRRRSKFRRDEVEIDCVLTDESYLLDSYNKKGMYSQLSVKPAATLQKDA